MQRERIEVARCTVERLMTRMGLRGATRGKSPRMTIPDVSAPCPRDRVNRVFKTSRPDELWVSDFTYVRTAEGWVYVAFVIDVFARRIVGWQASRSMETRFVLDALEQAVRNRSPKGDLIHHSDRGSQYVSIRYTERLLEAGIHPSVGSRGDSYDNALGETINGLYKTEVIHPRRMKSLQDVEWMTLRWVHWYNNHRIMESIGNRPPEEVEANYWQQLASESAVPLAA